MDGLIDGTPLLAAWWAVAKYATANAGGGDADGHVFNQTNKKATDGKDLYYGYVVLTSVSLTADNGSLATYSVSMQGKGAINKQSAGK